MEFSTDKGYPPAVKIINFIKKNKTPPNCSKWSETRKKFMKFSPYYDPLPPDIPNVLLPSKCRASRAILFFFQNVTNPALFIFKKLWGEKIIITGYPSMEIINIFFQSLPTGRSIKTVNYKRPLKNIYI